MIRVESIDLFGECVDGAKGGVTMRQNEITEDFEAPGADTPRVEACITEVMLKHPGESRTSLAKYFEAVHQGLAPLARELERENRQLRERIQAMWNENK